MESSYGWIITKDHIASNSNESDVGTIGPSNIHDEMMNRLKNGEGKHFRLYDDDRELYYDGLYIGEIGSEGDPLTDFGGPNAGCTYMEEYRDGKWEIIIG